MGSQLQLRIHGLPTCCAHGSVGFTTTAKITVASRVRDKVRRIGIRVRVKVVARVRAQVGARVRAQVVARVRAQLSGRTKARLRIRLELRPLAFQSPNHARQPYS